jgi:hypothetical protein
MSEPSIQPPVWMEPIGLAAEYGAMAGMCAAPLVSLIAELAQGIFRLAYGALYPNAVRDPAVDEDLQPMRMTSFAMAVGAAVGAAACALSMAAAATAHVRHRTRLA